MFSDDKRGGTAPTPTPTHQALAHDEHAAADPRHVRLRFVDLNSRCEPSSTARRSRPSSSPTSEAFDEWAAFKPVDEGRGSPPP